MKLKSKLIATIVSICAAIAVMGVGVWAASQNFTVSVTNNISLDFHKLGGTVSFSAATGADTYTGAAVSATDVTLLDAGVAQYGRISAAATSGTTGAEANYQFAGADFFDASKNYINADTKDATIEYTFKYVPSALDEQAGNIIAATITGDAEIYKNTDNTVTITARYFISNDGTTWYEVKNGKATAATQTLYVKAVCVYSNQTQVSAKTDSNVAWTFSVDFHIASGSDNALTGNAFTIGNSITAGKLSVTPKS